MHHPHALIEKYKLDCQCRKPKPGLILKAAKEHGIELDGSYMIGDYILDVKAGYSAGCRTIMLGHANATMFEILEREGLKPDAIVGSLYDASNLILSNSYAIDTKNKQDKMFI